MGNAPSATECDGFSASFALEVLETIAYEQGLESLVWTFSEKYLKELVENEATRLTSSEDSSGEDCSSESDEEDFDYAAVATSVLDKLKSCRGAFEKFSTHAKNMDRHRFLNLMTSGSFHVSKLPAKSGEGRCVFIRSGFLQNDTWRLTNDSSPEFHAHVVAFLWVLLSAEARVSRGESSGSCRLRVIFDEQLRGAFANFKLISLLSTYVHALHPIPFSCTFYGVSPQMANVESLLKSRFAGSDAVWATYAQGNLEWLAEALGDEKEAPHWLLERSEGVQHDPTDRRHVYCIERMIIPGSTVTMKDVFNPGPYDWDAPFEDGKKQKERFEKRGCAFQKEMLGCTRPKSSRRRRLSGKLSDSSRLTDSLGTDSLPLPAMRSKTGLRTCYGPSSSQASRRGSAGSEYSDNSLDPVVELDGDFTDGDF